MRPLYTITLAIPYINKIMLRMPIACYQKALQLQPDCVEAEVKDANALYAQRKLSPDKQAHYAAMNNDLSSKCRQAGDLKTAIAAIVTTEN
jgi:hypothetical protein